LPTINDSQHSRTTGGNGGDQANSEASSNHIAAHPVNSPKVSKKLIITEDQITRTNDVSASLANKNLSPQNRKATNINQNDSSHVKMKNPALPNI